MPPLFLGLFLALCFCILVLGVAVSLALRMNRSLSERLDVQSKRLDLQTQRMDILSQSQNLDHAAIRSLQSRQPLDPGESAEARARRLEEDRAWVARSRARRERGEQTGEVPPFSSVLQQLHELIGHEDFVDLPRLEDLVREGRVASPEMYGEVIRTARTVVTRRQTQIPPAPEKAPPPPVDVPKHRPTAFDRVLNGDIGDDEPLLVKREP